MRATVLCALHGEIVIETNARLAIYLAVSEFAKEMPVPLVFLAIVFGLNPSFWRNREGKLKSNDRILYISFPTINLGTICSEIDV